MSAPDDHPSIDAVVVAWNNCALTLDCLEHIERNTSASRLIVVDNGSSDDTVAAIRGRFPAATILELGENIGYGPAMNRGIEAGDGEFVALINNDANLEPEFLARTVAAFDDAKVGMVGGIALRPGSGDIDVAAIIVDRGLGAYPFLAARKQADLDVEDPRIVGPSHVNVVYRRAALDEVGTFDTEFFVYHEDIDLVLRMRQAGWESRVLADARSIHIGSASVGKRTATLVELSSWGRGYIAGRYRVALPWLLLDLVTGLIDCLAFRELTPIKSKIAGWRHGRSLPRRLPPEGIEYVSFIDAMRLRRNALLRTD